MSLDPTQWITAAQIDQLIQLHFGERLESFGFVKTKKRRWVRSRVPDIRDVFEFVSLRSRLNPIWGFSLDYCPRCPRVDGARLKWHRTEKSADIDVVHDPIDYVDAPGPDIDSWVLSYYQDVREAEVETVLLAKRAVPQSLEWFTRVNTVSDLVTLLKHKRSEPFLRFGFKNYVQQPLALLMSYALLGRTRRAEKLLNEYISYFRIPPEAAGRLHAHLARLAS